MESEKDKFVDKLVAYIKSNFMTISYNKTI